jgi:hypothetical protein
MGAAVWTSANLIDLGYSKISSRRQRNFGFYGIGNTSVPGIGIDKDDTIPWSK